MDQTLTVLQGKLKRDPSLYRNDFLLQYRHFIAQLSIFELSSASDPHEYVVVRRSRTF